MPFLFRKLDVYRRAIDLADRADRMASSMKRGHRHLADQLARAGISVPANIAEGNGRFTPGERVHFFAIARGSAYECVALLELASRRGLVDATEAQAMANELDEICRMINGLMRGARGQLTQ